ncbi:MAG: DNA polymerase IV [Deltaproteobacteria bacterium]|nr:DNA polymerase IV [Deltaproteobacteria bacterium]
MSRQIIHIHISSFAIAVERLIRPELRDRPVALAPPRSERALVLSASPEARKEGVFKGMPLWKARKRCPALTVLPPNPTVTEKACRALGDVAARYTPLWEAPRPGRIYLDVTGTERLWGRARDAARLLRRDVKDCLPLSPTVGVACNKMVSSIASRVLPGGGILDVEHGREAPFMAPLRVGMVPGIGHVRRKVLLEELNIFRVRQLALLDMGSMKLVFGGEALVIHQRALGIDPTPVCPALAKPVVGDEIVFPEDENDDGKLLAALYGLVERCAHRLRTRNLFPRKADLLVRYADQMETRRRVNLPRLSFWDADLYGPLETLFFKACTRRVRVRFMRVRFWDFTRPSGQLSLFHAPSPAREKQVRAVQAMDRIRRRYGEESIRYGKAA